MTMEPYQRAIRGSIAACNDMVARSKGCSDYESRLRAISNVETYQYDPTFREIMIKLTVMNHNANLPWWSR